MVAETLNKVLGILRRRKEAHLPTFDRGKSTAKVVREILEYLRAQRDELIPEDVTEDETDDRGTLLDAIRTGPGLVSHRTPDVLTIAAAKEPEGTTLMPSDAGLFRVKVTYSGLGVAGSATQDCSFSYNVTTLGGTQIGWDKVPEKPRYSNCKYNQPTANSPGLAYWDLNDPLVTALESLHLYEVLEEIPTTPTFSGVEATSDVNMVSALAITTADGYLTSLMWKLKPLKILEVGEESAAWHVLPQP